MSVVAYIAPKEKTSPIFCRAFAQGCDGFVTSDVTLLQGEVALFGSPKLFTLLRRAQSERRTWYYGDHAYLGRHKHLRTSKNGYQVLNETNTDSGRLDALNLTLSPWSRVGSHVLVCPQTIPYLTFMGVPNWLSDTLKTLRRHTDRELRIRNKNDPTPIGEDLKNCWAVVCYSSATAIDALIAGVPSFSTSELAAARRVGLSDLSQIEHPLRPENRREFLTLLANNQWTLDEYRSGVAWAGINQC